MGGDNSDVMIMIFFLNRASYELIIIIERNQKRDGGKGPGREGLSILISYVLLISCFLLIFKWNFFYMNSTKFVPVLCYNTD